MMNVADIEKLTDHEIASHASGAFGPKKRIEFIALVRRLAAGAQVKVDREVEPPSVASSGSKPAPQFTGQPSRR